MSLDALPYMAFLVVLEAAVGGAVVTYAVARRGLVTRGYIKFCAASTLACAALALWSALTLPTASSVSGYPLDTGPFAATRAAIAVLCALLAGYTWAAWTERDSLAHGLGLAASAVALLCVALAAAIFRLPTWGYTGVFASLLLGALSLGVVTLAMVLGHWYLTTPRLSAKPLNELSLAAIAVLAVQTAVVFLNLAAPVRVNPDPGAPPLIQDPAFWLRLLVGLAFPIVLAWLAWRASLIRGMMSATGLLYIATGAVLAGEALARGLQLATAKPF